MKMTSRGYVRPKKGSKTSRNQHPPPQDQDAFMEALGRDFNPFASDPSSHTPPEPRGKLHRPPPHPFNDRNPFPSSPYGLGPCEEEGFDFMGMGHAAGYSFPQCHSPSPRMRDQNVDRKSGGNYITIRSSDFVDREVAAKYVSLLIKHGNEFWAFKLPEGDDSSSRSEQTSAKFEASGKK